MAVYSPSGSGNVHVDDVLTQISIAWPNNGLVGNQLFPQVVVRKQSDKYYTFGREQWLPEANDLRAPGSVANEIPGMKVSLDTYYAQEHALQIAVTDEERENTDSPMSPDQDGTELVTSKIMLGREIAMRDLVVATANYATTLVQTLAADAKWDNYAGANSHPITHIRNAIRAMHALVFFEPNTILIPYLVMSYLQDHPDLIERIKYSERAILTPEIIAALLGVNQMTVITPGAGVGSGNNPAIMTTGYLWGDDVVLAYVPPRAGLRTPAFGYEFVWGYGGNTPQQVDRWREDPRKSDLIRVSRRYDLKLTGVENQTGHANFGKVITGAIIKDVLT